MLLELTGDRPAEWFGAAAGVLVAVAISTASKPLSAGPAVRRKTAVGHVNVAAFLG